MQEARSVQQQQDDEVVVGHLPACPPWCDAHDDLDFGASRLHTRTLAEWEGCPTEVIGQTATLRVEASAYEAVERDGTITRGAPMLRAELVYDEEEQRRLGVKAEPVVFVRTVEELRRVAQTLVDAADRWDSARAATRGRT